jgi:hypothetical protein
LVFSSCIGGLFRAFINKHPPENIEETANKGGFFIYIRKGQGDEQGKVN